MICTYYLTAGVTIPLNTLRNYNVVITSFTFWRNYVKMTSFWRNNDVIIAWCVCWDLCILGEASETSFGDRVPVFEIYWCLFFKLIELCDLNRQSTRMIFQGALSSVELQRLDNIMTGYQDNGPINGRQATLVYDEKKSANWFHFDNRMWRLYRPALAE